MAFSLAKPDNYVFQSKITAHQGKTIAFKVKDASGNDLTIPLTQTVTVRVTKNDSGVTTGVVTDDSATQSLLSLGFTDFQLRYDPEKLAGPVIADKARYIHENTSKGDKVVGSLQPGLKTDEKPPTTQDIQDPHKGKVVWSSSIKGQPNEGLWVSKDFTKTTADGQTIEGDPKSMTDILSNANGQICYVSQSPLMGDLTHPGN